MYVNISAVFGEGVSLEEGDFSEDPALRTATLAQKFKTLSLILYENKNASKIHFYIKGKLNSTEIEVGPMNKTGWSIFVPNSFNLGLLKLKKDLSVG